MTEFCSICGEQLRQDEEDVGICKNCQASIIINNNIPPHEENFQ